MNYPHPSILSAYFAVVIVQRLQEYELENMVAKKLPHKRIQLSIKLDLRLVVCFTLYLKGS